MQSVTAMLITRRKNKRRKKEKEKKRRDVYTHHRLLRRSLYFRYPILHPLLYPLLHPLQHPLTCPGSGTEQDSATGPPTACKQSATLRVTRLFLSAEKPRSQRYTTLSQQLVATTLQPTQHYTIH